jgi:2TM domain-containing protein
LSARTRDELTAPLADLPAAPRTPAPAVPRRSPADVGWRMHLTSYLAVIVGLWLIWALTGAGYPWPIWPMLGWGLGLIGHRGQLGLCGRVRTSTPG